MSRLKDTAAPARNFTRTGAERVRALVAGPPAWAVRRRRIEDLEAKIVHALVEDGIDGEEWPTALERDHARLVELVASHNRWYPIEANLPIDPLTSRWVDHGEPWRPMPAPTRAALLALAARARV